jgi:hypothetical protein
LILCIVEKVLGTLGEDITIVLIGYEKQKSNMLGSCKYSARLAGPKMSRPPST